MLVPQRRRAQAQRMCGRDDGGSAIGNHLDVEAVQGSVRQRLEAPPKSRLDGRNDSVDLKVVKGVLIRAPPSRRSSR